MAKTRRLLCLEALRAHLAAVVEGEPEADPYSFAYSAVKLGPLGDTDYRKRLVAGIVTGRARHEPLYPLDQVTLPLAIELRLMVNTGDLEPAIEAETLLGEVQRRVQENTTLGGLAVDLREVGSQVTLELYDDKSVIVTLFLDLLYRHHSSDPRLAV